ncbi:helix-turn-helix transcriptional regulator [Chryseobacterium rhizoplanae]|uniref:helix-turn-helix domain-containing protein n=1 Tax=Chryseobacterium rhizoplanae TaxID=1609531 RepID=UPI001CE3212E|nr:helix-turn-helix transcriptional regulator [Chryseobacterium rhizoplanae]UCA57895.1 helix-turn-helix transcriptional regulator [Chryseobacterium rhizoplanae]
MANILRIKEILKSKNMTINDLAIEMNISRVTLSNMINGNPTLETMQKIAQHLNVEFMELFSSIRQSNYTVSMNHQDNNIIYNDENIFLNGFLPHLRHRDYGTFTLEVKRKGFSIIPNSTEISKLIHSEETIEELIFKGKYDKEILIQLFSCYTSLSELEHKSFCQALKLYIHFHQQCKNEMNTILGTHEFNKFSPDSNYYELGMIDKSLWNKLIELTKKYDLDSPQNDFEKFNANGYDIIMYNLNIEKGYNIKLWLSIIEEKSSYDNVMVGWSAPDYFDRDLIKSKEVFNAKESYNFLHHVLIPMAKKL